MALHPDVHAILISFSHHKPVIASICHNSAEVFRNCEHIRDLFVRPDNVDQCKRAISAACKYDPRREFSLTYKDFKPDTFVTTFSMFSYNITKLDLSYNNIGVAGATELARTMAQTLTGLDLRGNNIGVAGATKLAKTIPQT